MVSLFPDVTDGVGVLFVPHPPERAAKQKQQVTGIHGHAILGGDLHALHQFQERVLGALTVCLPPIISVCCKLIGLIHQDYCMLDVRVIFEHRQQIGDNI